MMPIEPVVLSSTAALLLGLSFGAGPCNIACLPYLGPVFLARDGKRHSPWRTVLPFSAGRITGYSLLGTGAGWAGLMVQDWIAEPWVKWVLGSATIMVGISLLWMGRREKACRQRDRVSPQEVPFSLNPRASVPVSGGLFAMGLGMAFNPCAPLTTVVLASATSASALNGLFLGAGFGLGAVVIPALIFGYGIARFGEQIRLHLSTWRRPLESTSAGFLILLGGATAAGWITP